MYNVAASELQKSFGEWVERCQAKPVEITRYGRTSAYLVSAEMFEQMWCRLQRTIAVEALDDEDVRAIMGAVVMTAEPYDLKDIPEHDKPLPRRAAIR